MLDDYLKRQRAVLRGQSDTIAQPLVNDLAALMPFPITPHEDSHKQSSRVSSQALIRYRTNYYSVPTQYGHQAMLGKGTVDWVDIYLIGKTRAHCVSSPQLCQSRLDDESTALSSLAGKETACVRAFKTAAALVNELVEARDENGCVTYKSN